MTPADARTKWCPYVTVVAASINKSTGDDTLQDNRGYQVPIANAPNVNCIADGCMCWRWFGDTDGFCGLAGRPAA